MSTIPPRSIPYCPCLFTKKTLISCYHLLGPLAHLWLEMHGASQKYGEITRDGNRGPGTPMLWRNRTYIERASSPSVLTGWWRHLECKASHPFQLHLLPPPFLSKLILETWFASISSWICHCPPIFFPQQQALPLWGHVKIQWMTTLLLTCDIWATSLLSNCLKSLEGIVSTPQISIQMELLLWVPHLWCSPALYTSSWVEHRRQDWPSSAI